MIAVFNPLSFLARYPEFSGVNIGVLSQMFLESGLYLNNTNNSIVQDITLRTVLLQMITAHIAFIGGVLNAADGQPRPVGRVSAAGEGSVSASFEYTSPIPGSGPWFAMSQYGAAFWQATSYLRSARYVPSCQMPY